ncbi:MAG: hypothetical protein EA397_03005 [Deltaproteobacteria bacterium]|nr:MAG: hypothetical protein EA397_03005 [Deltaproteobacteria bacterium]
MAEDDKKQRVKDLLKGGKLDERATGGEDFGERVMRRHLRRPVGNSERLWKKVDGDDPWDLPKPPKPKKQRGVWAAGRFVRVETKEQKKKAAESHIPEWARKQAEQPRVPKAEAKPEPKADPESKIKEIVARKQAELDAKAQAAKPAPAPPSAEEPTTPPPRAVPPVGRRKASVSRSGRIRTHKGGAFIEGEEPPPPAEEPEVQHRYAAGRAPPPPRQKPKDLALEDRRPPRVDPHAPKQEIDPRQRRYAAGRAPPPPRKAPKDLAVEDRRPPRIDPNAPSGEPAEVQHRYAAGRAPPPPRKKPNELSIEDRMPSRIGADGKLMPAEAGATKATSASAQPPSQRSTPPPPNPTLTGPSPKPAPPSGAGNNASLDDIFGLAANEGRVRIGRRKKKAAEPGGADGDKSKGE